VYSGQPQWIGEIHEGDTVTTNWVKLGRKKAKSWHKRECPPQRGRGRVLSKGRLGE
jgi:hypothetical protein